MQAAVGVGAGTGPSSNKMPTLEEYGTNLTTQATEVCSRLSSLYVSTNLHVLARCLNSDFGSSILHVFSEHSLILKQSSIQP